MLSILEKIRENQDKLAHDSIFYKTLNDEAIAFFQNRKDQTIWLNDIIDVTIPYVEMGKINTQHLFGLDELIMFSYYYYNCQNYNKAIDIGANLGLHSIVMAKCGFNVIGFEPDPWHFEQFTSNISLNNVTEKISPKAVAISDRKTKQEFVRVLGNTTSSHLKGAKKSAYGELEYFMVDVDNVNDHVTHADLMKIDAEGHECVIIKAISYKDWANMDAFVEIGTQKNADIIFDYFDNSNINIFSQKISWNKVKTRDELPFSYKEGGIFISSKQSMLW